MKPNKPKETTNKQHIPEKKSGYYRLPDKKTAFGV